MICSRKAINSEQAEGPEFEMTYYRGNNMYELNNTYKL